MRASQLGRSGKFLRASDIIQHDPDMLDFFGVVESVKESLRSMNAAYVLVLDETPVAGCNEVPVNSTNSGRIVRFLLSAYGNDDLSNLIGCAVYFRLRSYPDFVAPDGQPTVGLEISAIEPADDASKTMRFDQPPPAEKKINQKRAAILARSSGMRHEPSGERHEPSGEDVPFGNDDLSETIPPSMPAKNRKRFSR